MRNKFNSLIILCIIMCLFGCSYKYTEQVKKDSIHDFKGGKPLK